MLLFCLNQVFKKLNNFWRKCASYDDTQKIMHLFFWYFLLHYYNSALRVLKFLFVFCWISVHNLVIFEIHEFGHFWQEFWLPSIYTLSRYISTVSYRNQILFMVLNSGLEIAKFWYSGLGFPSMYILLNAQVQFLNEIRLPKVLVFDLGLEVAKFWSSEFGFPSMYNLLDVQVQFLNEIRLPKVLVFGSGSEVAKFWSSGIRVPFNVHLIGCTSTVS